LTSNCSRIRREARET